MPMTPLRYAAIAEAVTLLLLICVAMPLKYAADLPIATKIMGPIHGVAFLTFLWIAIQSWAAGLVTMGQTGRLLLGAMIPLGGFINERWLHGLTSGED